MADTVRTFVAIEIPPEIRDRANRVVSELRASQAKVKWVTPHNMHWSLKFLGEVPMRETADVCAAVARAVEPFAPFDVEARGVGAFPDLRSPRTVWIGMGRGTEEISEVHAAVERELSQLGFRRENRKFRPHLTIGRVRNSPSGISDLEPLIQAQADFVSGLSTVYEVVVMSSDLQPDGPSYEPLGHLDLKG